jgi:hypothetical protein
VAIPRRSIVAAQLLLGIGDLIGIIPILVIYNSKDVLYV